MSVEQVAADLGERRRVEVEAHHALERVSAQLDADVREARRRGLSWQQVADALGMSRQGAHKRFRSAGPMTSYTDQPLEP